MKDPHTLLLKITRILELVLAAAILILLLKVELRFLPVSYGIGWLSMLIYELPLLIRYLKYDKL